MKIKSSIKKELKFIFSKPSIHADIVTFASNEWLMK